MICVGRARLGFSERNIQCVAGTRPDDQSQYLSAADLQRVFSSRAGELLGFGFYFLCALLDPARLRLTWVTAVQ
ncbi:hypothetical protein GA0074695_2803 [Micromonospora viridifaciens]|uniref:Uncharacterized protein n=1 Tax=Micromonospora viridifaciens TaxID=1881 RepID=A0A1C4WVZ0_MICVI|nr:hypothetical protein GA0074695_2803 [Micromonospora viridifaciens]